MKKQQQEEGWNKTKEAFCAPNPTSVWSSTSRAPVKTHTYDIYIKLLYIYIKLCLFSKKLQPEKDSLDIKVFA